MARYAAGINAMYSGYENMLWRVGRRVGQCVHAQVRAAPSEEDVLLFACPSPSLASLVVREHNAALGYEAT